MIILVGVYVQIYKTLVISCDGITSRFYDPAGRALYYHWINRNDDGIYYRRFALR